MTRIHMEARGSVQHAAQTLEFCSPKPTGEQLERKETVQTDYHNGGSCIQMLRPEWKNRGSCTSDGGLEHFFSIVLDDCIFLLSPRISNLTTCLYTLTRSQFLSAIIRKCRRRDSTAGIFIHEQYITFKNRSCCT